MMERSSENQQDVQERQWFNALRSGSVQAFESIYAHFSPTLYSFAQRLVSADSAEDIVQDVLVDLWERRDSLSIRTTLKSYLLGATYRRALYRFRSERIHARAVDRIAHDADMLGSATVEPTDRAAESNEAQYAVKTAIATLPLGRGAHDGRATV